MSYFRFPKYVSVAEKKAKAEKKLKQLRKKRPDIQPVIVQGNQLAHTWWGKAWNKNLTEYADYSNRVGRGRSYLRHGAVLDLKIDSGTVNAMVQGSSTYEIKILIEKISTKKWNNIKKECAGKIDSLQELLQGKFPKAMDDIFTSIDLGLFPSPKEIEFSCSCPDWAYMCKHVAAVLFGIGTRLDDDPMLFFKLRGIDGDELVTQVVQDNTKKLLKKAKKKSSKVMDDINISEIFGIDIDMESQSSSKNSKKKKSVSTESVPKAKKKVLKPSKSAKKIKKKVLKPPKLIKKLKKTVNKITLKKKPLVVTKKIDKKTDQSQTIDTILKTVQRSKKAFDIPTLQERTGIDDRQKVYNAVYRLIQMGKIERVDRGLYQKIK
ncbi:Zinc finger, SWIM-type [Candidatus Magnetomorum sp. HK-1]|nr:Zinc finger, SWIM-type [Candidatus Magnetomorum sp. HK-1]